MIAALKYLENGDFIEPFTLSLGPQPKIFKLQLTKKGVDTIEGNKEYLREFSLGGAY